MLVSGVTKMPSIKGFEFSALVPRIEILPHLTFFTTKSAIRQATGKYKCIICPRGRCQTPQLRKNRPGTRIESPFRQGKSNGSIRH